MSTLETLIVNAKRRVEESAEAAQREEHEREQERRRAVVEQLERELNRAMGALWMQFGGTIETTGPAGSAELVFEFRDYELELRYCESDGVRWWVLSGPKKAIDIHESIYESVSFPDRLLLAIDAMTA